MEGVQGIAVPPWLYEETGPFTVYAAADGTMFAQHAFDSLREALQWWIRFHIGPISMRTALVHDAHKQVLVGYSWYLLAFTWMGTARGFAALAEVHDPMSVAVWERLAIGDDAPTVPTEKT